MMNRSVRCILNLGLPVWDLSVSSVGCFVFTGGLRSFAIGKEGLQTGAYIRAAGPARKTLAGIPFKSAA
jgi:hypothetical protein